MEIKNIIFVVFILTAIPISYSLESDNIFFIELIYLDGEFELLDVSVVGGYAPVSEDSSLPYILEVVSGEGQVIYTSYFDVPNKVYAPPPIEEGDGGTSFVEIDNVKFILSLPYDKSAALIRIIQSGQELLSIDVSGFAQYCGDGICQYDEDYITCAEDCLSEQTVAETEEGLEKDGRSILPYLLGLTILVVIFVGLWTKREWYVLRKIAEKHGVHFPHGFINKLVNHIGCLKKDGYSDEKITDHLRSMGWKQKQINEGFTRHELLEDYHNLKNQKKSNSAIKRTLTKSYNPEQVKGTLEHFSTLLGKNPNNDEKINHLRELADEHDIDDFEGIDKIKEYVKKCYDKGFSKEEVISVLKKKKWPEEMVEKAFDGLS
ncbi:MAG: hypothetical protein U9O94_05405 [Nanoarchaeota archaeon]|nr:hypothetical protein [Nanoarchaeota archaeon]